MTKWYYKNLDRAKAYAKEYNRSPEAKRLPHARFMKARSEANRRGIEWLLTEKEYIDALGNMKCFYCSSSIAFSSGCGLDRVDNSIGYVVGNVVACCHPCNTVKGPSTYVQLKAIVNGLESFSG